MQFVSGCRFLQVEQPDHTVAIAVRKEFASPAVPVEQDACLAAPVERDVLPAVRGEIERAIDRASTSAVAASAADRVEEFMHGIRPRLEFGQERILFEDICASLRSDVDAERSLASREFANAAAASGVGAFATSGGGYALFRGIADTVRGGATTEAPTYIAFGMLGGLLGLALLAHSRGMWRNARETGAQFAVARGRSRIANAHLDTLAPQARLSRMV